MSSNQSEGKFLNKLKNTFRKDSTSSSKLSGSEKSSTSKSKEGKVLQEAHQEGENQALGNTNAAGVAGGAGAGAVGGAGIAGSSANAASGSSSHHQSILKEAYHEGEKLFHIKHKTGKYPSTTSGSGSGVGGVAASSGNQYGHKKTSSTSSESSKGRLVSSPPQRSRKPLDHEIPGDFTNEKQPTDPSVLAGAGAGAGAVGGAGLATSSKHSNPTTGGIINNDHPQYSDGAKQASGEGKFFEPKDTQGGTLGAATHNTDGYNERTKQNVTDFDKLKTQPSAYEQEQKQQQEFKEIKQLSYKEGNKKGRLDIQSNPSLAGSRQVGGPTQDDSIDKNAIHQENKSAYNKDGVSGILNEQGISQEKPKHTKKSDKINSNEPQYDHFGQPINPHTGTTGVSAGALSAGAGTAATAHGVSHTSHDPVEDQRRISDLDQQINQTDARIKQLRNDPSNASRYAVNDEPIKTPKLANLNDEDDDETFVDTATGEHISSRSPTTTTTTTTTQGPYDSSRIDQSYADKQNIESHNKAISNHQDTGVIATATGAVAAAAGYLGFNKANESSSSSNDYDLENIKSEAYKAGHKQGNDIWGGSASDQTKTTNTHPQDTTLTQAHAVGYQQGTKDAKHEPTSSTYNDSTSSTHQPKSSTYQSGENYGHELAEQARHAVEAASATAAGVLGYNTVSNAREGHQKLLDDSYKAGQDKAHNEAKGTSGQEGYLSSALGALGLGGKSSTNEHSKDSSSPYDQTHNHKYGENVPKDESLTKPSGGYVSIPKEKEEIHRNPNKIPKDESLTKPDESNHNTGVLASAGAAVGGAYNYLRGGSTDDSNKNTTTTSSGSDYQVKDSLIGDAEKADPSIDKYPAHKVNKEELKEQESLGANATPQEKHVVDSNNDKKWEKETEDYDEKHGYGEKEKQENPGVLASAGAAAGAAAAGAGAAVGGAFNYLKSGDTKGTNDSSSSDKNTTSSKNASDYMVHDSLIKDAVEDDPSIEKLPAHKGNKKAVKAEEEGPKEANDDAKQAASANQFHEMEDDVAKWNREHGFKNPKSSLIEVAEEADPSIKKKSAHKGVSIDQEDTGNNNAESGDNVQPLPSGLPSGKHSEIKENIGNTNAVGNAANKKSSTTDSTEDNKYEKASKQAAGAGIGGVGAHEATKDSSSSKDKSSSSEEDKELDSSLKKQLYESGYEKGKQQHQGLDASIKKQVYESEFAKGKQHHQGLDASIKKQVYESGFAKGKQQHQNKSVGGAAYNQTKPVGSEEYPLDRKATDDAYSNHGVGNTVPSGAGLVPGGVLGSSHTKDQVYKEAHQEAQSNQHGQQHSLDPSLKQQIYQHGYNQGKNHSQSSSTPIGGGAFGSSNLDSKLKQDIYEHGHAKGSLEKKQERDSRISNQPYGSSNREAAVIGGAGLGAATATGVSAPHQQHSGLHTPIDKNSELVEEKEAKQRHADNSKDNLVVEVIGIENKEDALRTAKKASKKLDEKGVDLTSGKLVINANTKEIYKTDGTTNETSTTPFDSEHNQQQQQQQQYPSHNAGSAVGAGLAGAGLGGAAGAAYGHHNQQSNVPETYGQSRAAGYTQGLDDTSYRGEGVGKTTQVDPNTYGQTRAAGYTQGLDDTHYRGEGVGKTTQVDPNTYGQTRTAGYTQGLDDTHYRGEGVGKTTQVDPNTYGQTRTAGYTQGLDDTQYRGEGVGKKTELDPTHHQSTKSTGGYDENEAAKQRLADAARRNVSSTQKHPESSTLGTAGAAGVAGGASHPTTSHGQQKSSNDEIFVNVKGTKDNLVATKIAESAVKRLQKSHANVVAKVKEIQVDASSGIVRDENGDEIAHYPDLAIDPSGSHKKSSSGDYTHHQQQQPSSSSYGNTNTLGSAGAGGVGGGLAAAAASKASHDYSNPHEPTRKTHANEFSSSSSSSKAQPPYPQGVPSTKEQQQYDHLQGANAYPTSAINAHDSSESSLDKKIHETNLSGTNYKSQPQQSSYTTTSGSNTTNQAATLGGIGNTNNAKDIPRDYQNTSTTTTTGLGNTAATNTTYTNDVDVDEDLANTSSGSYMPGSWV